MPEKKINNITGIFYNTFVSQNYADLCSQKIAEKDENLNT